MKSGLAPEEVNGSIATAFQEKIADEVKLQIRIAPAAGPDIFEEAISQLSRVANQSGQEQFLWWFKTAYNNSSVSMPPERRSHWEENSVQQRKPLPCLIIHSNEYDARNRQPT